MDQRKLLGKDELDTSSFFFFQKNEHTFLAYTWNTIHLSNIAWLHNIQANLEGIQFYGL